MRVAGVAKVRNEVDIMQFCVWHHLDQGLDFIAIVDNGSTDGTYELLREMQDQDERVHVFSEPGPFEQERFISEMSNLAWRNSCDWVVPFDADEMWLSENTLKKDLANIGSNAVRIYLRNYIQNVEERTVKPGLYETVNYRIVTDVPYAPADAFLFGLVDTGDLSMVEMGWYPKNIVRASEDLMFSAGAHQYTGQKTTYVTDPRFIIYHVPLRSYKHLEYKAEHGRRLIEVGHGPGVGIEQQRIYRLKQQNDLEAEWLANTERDGKLHRRNTIAVDLEYDTTVSDLYKRFKEESVDYI